MDRETVFSTSITVDGLTYHRKKPLTEETTTMLVFNIYKVQTFFLNLIYNKRL